MHISGSLPIAPYLGHVVTISIWIATDDQGWCTPRLRGEASQQRQTLNESRRSCYAANVAATARLICLTLRNCWMSPTTGCSAIHCTILLTHCIYSSPHSPLHRSTTTWDDACTTDSCQHKAVTCVTKFSLDERCIKTVTEFVLYA